MSGEIHRREPATPIGLHAWLRETRSLPEPAGKGTLRKPAVIDLPLARPKERPRHDDLVAPPSPRASSATSTCKAGSADEVRFHGWPPRPGPRLGDRSTRTAQALENAARKMEQAEARGVLMPRLSFMRRLQQVAQVPVAAFDLLLACVATVATLGLIGPAVAMAAGKLKEAVKAVTVGQEAPVQTASVLPDSAPAAPAGDPPVLKAAAALREARVKMEHVKQQTGVDFARCSFISRSIGVAVGMMGVGLAIAATVASGGMAAPALVLTAILLRQAIANARCAWRNLQRVSAGQPALPMGANALANAMYAYHMAQPGMTPERARLSASRSAGATTAATVGATVALGAVFAVAVPLVEKCIRAFCSVAQRTVLPPLEFAVSQMQKDGIERLHKQADARATAALREMLRAQGELRCALEIPDDATGVRADQPVFDALIHELRRWPARRPELDAMVRHVEEALQSGPLRPSDDPQEVRRKKQAEQLAAGVFATSTLTLSTSLLVSLAG